MRRLLRQVRVMATMLEIEAALDTGCRDERRSMTMVIEDAGSTLSLRCDCDMFPCFVRQSKLCLDQEQPFCTCGQLILYSLYSTGCAHVVVSGLVSWQ